METSQLQGFSSTSPQETWETDASQTYRRLALLITADKYEQYPSWSLPTTLRNGRLLRDALQEYSGYDESAILWLKGKDVHEDYIEGEITRLAKMARPGERTLFLIYFAGHGWTQDEDQQFFTYFTRRKPGTGNFEKMLSRSKLLSWIDKAQKDANQRQAQLEPVLIADCCRTSKAGPPAKPKITPSKVWEIYSTRDGEFADANQGGDAFPFTRAWTESLKALWRSGTESTLVRVFNEARKRTLELTNQEQEPQLVAPKGLDQPKLVVPGQIQFTLRLIDAVTRVSVEAARVKLDYRSLDLKGGDLSIYTDPGNHEIAIRTNEFLPRTMTVRLDTTNRNRILSVPLQPKVYLIKGQVSPANATVQVQWRGQATARPQYHRAVTTTDRGRFRLLIPALEGQIEFRAGNEVLKRIPVPQEPSGLLAPEDKGIAGYDSLPFARISVDLPESASISDPSSARPSALPRLLDEMDRANWHNFNHCLNRRSYEAARGYLAMIQVDSDALREWRRWIGKQWARRALIEGFRKGKATGDWSLADEARAWAEQHPNESTGFADAIMEIERERITLDSRKYYQAAIKAETEQSFETALQLYGKAMEGANSYYTAQIERRIAKLRVYLYKVYANTAEQYLLLDKKEDAVLEFMKAVRVNPRSSPRLAAILHRHPELKNTEVGRQAADMLTKEQRTLTQTSWIDLTNSIGMRFKRIPAGSFMMGSPQGERDRAKMEGPVHKVTLTKSFYLGQTAVTQGQWYAVMESRPWAGQPSVKEGDDYPATYISWQDAVAFCKKLSKKEGVAYRLPTEAEWEYACRAGTDTRFSYGDDRYYSQLGAYAWYANNAWDTKEKYAHPVARKKPNPWGLYDMHGGVWEWCSDWFGPYPNTAQVDPKGRSRGRSRVMRGGSWSFRAEFNRSATRCMSYHGARVHNFGFRVLRTAK